MTDVLVTNKEIAGRTLAELSARPSAHGVFLRKIMRNMMPQPSGAAGRLAAWLSKHSDAPGAEFLGRAVDFGVKTFKFDADAFVYEMTNSIIGDNYPVPDRMLIHAEQVVHKLHHVGDVRRQAAAGQIRPLRGRRRNRRDVLYFQIAHGEPHPEERRYHRDGHADLHALYRNRPTRGLRLQGRAREGDQENRFQYPAEELKKLEDPKIKAFFVCNPGNPTSMAIDDDTRKKLVNLVKNKRPDLILLTDDVYGTFVPGFRSLMAELPHNTIGVYSYSKYFGCTGWRLGVIALHENNCSTT